VVAAPLQIMTVMKPLISIHLFTYSTETG
jgi:hypothetical protein